MNGAGGIDCHPELGQCRGFTEPTGMTSEFQAETDFSYQGNFVFRGFGQVSGWGYTPAIVGCR